MTYDSEAQGDRNVEASDLEDTAIVRLEPDQSFGTTYDFSVVDKLAGFRHSDVHNLATSKTYYITLRPQRWRWMYEDDMLQSLTMEEKRIRIHQQPLTEWLADCCTPFECVNGSIENESQSDLAFGLYHVPFQATIPVATTVSASAPTCSCSGGPPFAVTVTHRSIFQRPIWALVDLYPRYNCHGVQIRGLTRNNRSTYPHVEVQGINQDIVRADHDDPAIVRLDLGQSFSTTITFGIVNKPAGRDVDNFIVGNDYTVTLLPERWRWMFEHDMPDIKTTVERRLMLSQRPFTQWQVHCDLTFKCTE